MKRFVKCKFFFMDPSDLQMRPVDSGCKILFPVFGGEIARVKIQMVNGLRVEISSQVFAKNTIRPLTIWIVETDIERGLLSTGKYATIKPVN